MKELKPIKLKEDECLVIKVPGEVLSSQYMHVIETFQEFQKQDNNKSLIVPKDMEIYVCKKSQFRLE
jgi:hypothetical protein